MPGALACGVLQLWQRSGIQGEKGCRFCLSLHEARWSEDCKDRKNKFSVLQEFTLNDHSIILGR